MVSLIAAPGLDGLLGALLAGTMIAIAVVDATSYRIPNELTLAVLALALLRASLLPSDAALHPVADALLRAAVTSVLFYILAISYRHFRGRDGFGFGDVKLLGAAAAWLDWSALLIAIEGATLAALATYLVRQWFYRRPIKTMAMLPFGSFLAPFIWIGWLIEPFLN